MTKARVFYDTVFAVLLVLLCSSCATGQESSNWINVKDVYGAVGDGKADDTAALQKAFDNCTSVFLPAGAYRITRTLELRPKLNVYGENCLHGDRKFPGAPKAQGHSELLYDGPSGGVAVSANDAGPVSVRRILINGNAKAAIGIKGYLFGTRSVLEDVQIMHTLEHAVYMTYSWTADFIRLKTVGNYGNGVTLGKPGSGGEVNDFNFRSCQFQANGLAKEGKYDGKELVDVNYGLGIIGAVTSISVTDCLFQTNQGAGLYIGPGRKVNVFVRGGYFESNSKALSEKDRELHGDGYLKTPNRKPVGRKVSILVDSPQPNRMSIVFDSVFISGKRNGIWLKGASAGGLPIQFRNFYRPNVIYSEHGNWEWIDSTKAPIALEPGINVKVSDQDWKKISETAHITNFLPGTNVPGGHPAICVSRGKRQVFPYDPEGLALYVDTDKGNDRNDGRTATKAWASLKKVTKLFENSDVETPYTIIIAGKKPSALSLKNLRGSGDVTVRLQPDVHLTELELVNLGCRTVVQGRGLVTMDKATVDRCASLSLSGIHLRPAANSTGIAISGGSNAKILGCTIKGENNSGFGIVAEMSRVFADKVEISGLRPGGGIVSKDGASVHLGRVSNRCGTSGSGGSTVLPGKAQDAPTEVQEVLTTDRAALTTYDDFDSGALAAGKWDFSGTSGEYQISRGEFQFNAGGDMLTVARDKSFSLPSAVGEKLTLEFAIRKWSGGALNNPEVQLWAYWADEAPIKYGRLSIVNGGSSEYYEGRRDYDGDANISRMLAPDSANGMGNDFNWDRFRVIYTGVDDGGGGCDITMQIRGKQHDGDWQDIRSTVKQRSERAKVYVRFNTSNHYLGVDYLKSEFSR